MTKSWDDIRPETCKMLAEKRSLQYIRTHLRQTKKFDASTRAFRLKIKEWKVRRVDAAPVAGVEERRSTAQTPQFALAGPQSMLLPHTSDMEIASTTGSTINLSHVRTAEPSKYSPERAYVRLVQGEDAAEVLARCEFSDNGTNVLHVAVKAFNEASQRDGLQEILEHISKYVRAKDCIDHRDELGDTALSLAVKASQPALVFTLLEYGASADSRDRGGNTPLHNAVMSRTPSSICEALLSHGADVHITALNGHTAQSSLSLAVSVLDLKSKSPLQKCTELTEMFDIITRLIDAGAGWDSNGLVTTVGAFIRCWISTPGRVELLDSAKPILRTYLTLGQDPTQSFAQDWQYCTKRSLARCAFSHGPNDQLASFLGQTAAKSHMPSLISYVLKCADCPPNGPIDLTTVLEALLARITDEEFVAHAPEFVQMVLCRAPNPRKLPFLKALRKCRPTLAHHFIPDNGSKVIRALLTTNHHDRWDLAAELMQPQLERGSSSLFGVMMKNLYAMVTGTENLSAVEYYIKDYIWNMMMVGSPWAVRLILHVVTKTATDNLAAGDDCDLRMDVRRLHEILRLRHQYKFPAIHVATKVLFEALESSATISAQAIACL